MWNLFDYLPEIISIISPSRHTFLIRKRIFHPGWQISYKVEKYLSDDSYWELYANVASRDEALTVIRTITKDK